MSSKLEMGRVAHIKAVSRAGGGGREGVSIAWCHRPQDPAAERVIYFYSSVRCIILDPL